MIYYIIIKLLNMENHPSQNRKRNSLSPMFSLNLVKHRCFILRYFDNSEKRCLPFYYGGCEGNDNRFDSLEQCQVRKLLFPDSAKGIKQRIFKANAGKQLS